MGECATRTYVTFGPRGTARTEEAWCDTHDQSPVLCALMRLKKEEDAA